MRALRVVFVVQGEGRGHMTQALALASILRSAGHDVTRVLVGRSPHRSIPDYFSEGVGAPVVTFAAPTQVPGDDQRALSVGRTLADAVRRSPRFLRSMVSIAGETKEADVVVNLLDLMGGASRRLFPSPVPSLAVAHNYLFLHAALSDAPGPSHVRRLVMAYAKATAARTERKLALSFEPLPADPRAGVEVVPPLLRPGLDALTVSDDGYLLAYALNAGYGERLARWQSTRPETEVHCYVEGGAAAMRGKAALRGEADLHHASSSVRGPDRSGPGFHAHDLDGAAFLQHLAGCRAYVGSAGFESLCEAHYLGKPILAVPTEGQFEQTLNAWDAARVGVARAGTYEDLDDFWDRAERPDPTRVAAFHDWVSRAPSTFVDAVERTSQSIESDAVQFGTGAG